MGLIETVAPGPVGLDSAVFIYFIESNPRYVEQVRPLFEAGARGEIELVTSALTLLEVLVAPYRAGNLPLAKRYEALLTRGRGLRLVEIGPAELRTAAQLRAQHSIRTPDALQIAAALRAGCTAFVTNDRRLPRLSNLSIVQLADLT